MFKRSLWLKVMMFAAVLCGGLVASFNVYADGTGQTGPGGGGALGGSGNHCCDSPHAVTPVCNGRALNQQLDVYLNCTLSSRMVKLGGASWHVFKTGKKYNSTTKLYTDETGPSYLASLDKGGYDRQLATKCNSDDYDYYVAYVYDGWNRDGISSSNTLSNGWYDRPAVYWGPLAWWVRGDAGGGLQYNGNDLYTSSEIKRLAKSGNVAGKRIGPKAARELYNDYRSAVGLSEVDELPSDLGYFCFASNVTLRMEAYTVKGKPLNRDQEVTFSLGDKKPLTAFDPIEENGVKYVFVGIYDGKTSNANLLQKNRTYSKAIKKNKTVYALYDVKIEERTLILQAVDQDGKERWGDKYNVSSTVNKGRKASVKRKVRIIEEGDGVSYVFKGIFKNKTGGERIDNSGIYSVVMNGDKKTETVYARYEKVKKEVVLTGTPVNERGEVIGKNVKCKTEEGGNCSVKVKDSIGDYKFLYWSNKKQGGTKLGSNLTYTKNNMTKDLQVWAVYEKATPVYGCERWVSSSFSSSNSMHGVTLTASRVKNDALGTDWVETVYAKPTDEISWINCYFPGVQKTAETLVTTNHYSGHYPESDGGPDNSYSLNFSPLSRATSWSNMYSISKNFVGNNTKTSESFNYGDYAEKEYVDATVVKMVQVGTELFEKIASGQPTLADVETKSSHSWGCHWGIVGYHTETKTVGTDKDGKPITTSYSVADYGWKDTCSHSEVFVDYSVGRSGADESMAKVWVPYNFENTTTLDNRELLPEEDIDEQSTVFYAGETKTVVGTVIVKPKENSITSRDAAYSTTVPNAKWKLRVCYNDESVCSETNPITDNLDISEDEMWEEKEFTKEYTFNVPDVPAGTEICLRTAVYPANSGADDNYQDAEGSHAWSEWSEKRCFTVAKRPSLQVWGGNVYSAKDIEMGISEKNVLYGYDYYNDIEPSKNSKTYVFGSWGELGVIGAREVKNFASGATLGYAGLNGNKTVPDWENNTELTDPGGGRGANQYCGSFVPLTFAQCYGFEGSGSSSNDAVSGVEADMSEILNTFAPDIDNIDRVLDGYIGGTLLSKSSGSPSDTDIKMFSYDGDVLQVGSAGAISVVTGTKIVMARNGNVRIEGDIWYSEEVDDGQPLTNLRTAPKLVIYAVDGDILIDCEVNRIDALLVAKGKVETCDASNIDVENDGPDGTFRDANSKQLVIYGAVLASKLVANRTYGAARGVNSIVPAEIIMFDPTLYSWGGIVSNITSDGTTISAADMTTTYIREIAPRY